MSVCIYIVLCVGSGFATSLPFACVKNDYETEEEARDL
jgi:hypothetical protein